MRETATGLDATAGLTSSVSLTPAQSAGALLVPELETSLKPEQRIDFSKFSAEQMRRIQQIANTVSLDDTGSMMSFAMEPQRRVNDALDGLTAGLTAADAGAVGDLTVELATSIKALNLQKMKKEAEGKDWFASTFGKLPLVGSYFSAFRHYQLTHKQINEHIAKVEAKADKEYTKVKASVSKLDGVFDVTLNNIKELELWVAAAHIVLEHARKQYAERAAVAREKKDPILASALRDFQGRYATFETRLVRMHVGVAESLLSLPQIRQTQQAGGIAMFSIMDTLLFDMPKLKRLVLMLASLKSIRDATQAEERRQAVLRQMDKIADETVSEVYITALESQGQGMARLTALSERADNILQTLARGAELEVENARTRQQIIAGVEQVKRKFVVDLQTQSERFLEAQNGSVVIS